MDLTLAKGADGLWRPKVSVADVAFSAGGSGPFAVVNRDGKRFTLAWPASLPAAVVAGDSLTYPGVLPDVDLVVRATRTGFTHVLVVRNAAAAARSELRRIRLVTGGGARLRRSADGTLQAVDGATVIANGRQALMWDSSATANREATAEKPARSTAVTAGDAARIRSVGVELDGKDGLVLVPDAALLAASSAFPVFIDPDWSYGEGSGQKWAYANSTNVNNETSTARVGKSPDFGNVYRSFFEFPMSSNGISLQGKYIQSAYVSMTLTHSHACDNQWNYLYLTPAINAVPKASWTGMTLDSLLAAQVGHANETGGCQPVQDDMVMNYQGSGITGQVQTAAGSGWSALTVGFAARDEDGGGESTITRWMKFWPEAAKLIVDYDSRPTAPYSLMVSGVACPGTGSVTVGTLAPNVSAIHPDEDATQTLSGGYEWIEVPAEGIGAVTDTWPQRGPAPGSVPVTAGGRAQTAALSGVVKGKTYAFRARSTDPAPYNIASPWSGWCQFRVDDTVPAVSVRVVAAPAGPGKPGTFEISSPDSDVTTFKWGWGSATTAVPAPTGSPKKVLFTATAPKYGHNLLFASAVDGTGNEGFASTEFVVGRPAPAVARWGLEQRPGVDATTALADQQPMLGGNTPLSPTHLAWATDARQIGGSTARFGESGMEAYALTAAPVVDTSKSFSIAAWVRPQACTQGFATIASADGSRSSAFMLDRACATNTWRLATHTQDADGGGVPTEVRSTEPVPVGRWTHVAAVYDSAEKQTRLYIDGALKGSANVTGIFPAAGSFVVGRAKWLGGPGQYFRGEIADVLVFDRVLVEHDFTGMSAYDPNSGGFNEPGVLSPVQVGQWDFEAAVPCYVQDLRDTCESPDISGWDRWAALSYGAAVSAGRSTSDSGVWLNHTTLGDDIDPNPGTNESARTARKTGITPPDGNGNEFTIWQDTPAVRTDQSFTVSAWVNLQEFSTGNQAILAQDGVNASGFWLGAGLSGGQTRWTLGMADTDTVNPGARVASSAPLTTADLRTWQHVTGVFDAQRNEIRLYVNGLLKARSPRTFNGVSVTPWHAGGALTVGRAKWNGSQSDHFNGAIDELRVFDGAMTDTAVFEFHNSQVAPRPGTNVLMRGQTLVADQYIRSDINNYELIMQGDGNLVLYQAGQPIWDTGTWGNPGAWLVMQHDGNLVVYRSDGVPLWDSGTYGTAADRLYVQADGNVVLYGPDWRVYWHRTQTSFTPSGAIVNPATGRCMAANSTADGAKLELRACNGLANQRLEVHADGSIVNPDTGKCVAANATTEGAGLELWGCNGMGHQLFELRPNGYLVNPATGRCVAANATTEGAGLELWGCNGMGHQLFAFGLAASVVNPATGRCVAANATTEGAGLELWGCNEMGHQLFDLRPDGAIVNPVTGRCATAAGLTDGAKLELRACNGLANQRFELRADRSIVNPVTGKCVAANATTEGAGLELWGCNGMGHMLFELRYHTGP